jgi:predicted helicase
MNAGAAVTNYREEYSERARMEEERNLTTEYRKRVEGMPQSEGNGLNNLYIRFFRVAERRIVSNEVSQGIVSFISAYSWLDGLSHPGMRHRILTNFDKIYIDNLHGDRKISEYAPDGQTSETVFKVAGMSPGILVGTAVSTLVRTRSGASAELRYRDFTEAKASVRRAALLAAVREETKPYKTSQPNPALGLPFKPRDIGLDYLSWPRVPELFVEGFPCIKTSRDPLLVDLDWERLEARIKDYFNSEITDAEFAINVPSAMTSTKRFDAVETRRKLQQRGYRPWQIVRVVYRPFDARWLYWEPTTKLLDEKREQFVASRAAMDLALILPRIKSRQCGWTSSCIWVCRSKHG